MGHDVFISHSSLDKLAADAVCHGLEAKGVRCWIAPRDQVAGRPYGEQITAAIKSAEVMVLIFSDNVNNSQAVLNEINVAAGSNVTIVPFRLAAVDFSSELHFYLGRMHWLDAFPPPLDAHLELLTDTVQRNLKRPPPVASEGPAAAPVASAPPPLPPPVGLAPAHPATATPRRGIRHGLILAGVLGSLFLVLLIVIAWPRPPDPVRDQAANTLMQSVANVIAKTADDSDDDEDDKGAANRTGTAGPKPSSDHR